MHFISAALRVDCLYCHVPDAREKDDKKAKQTARRMMRMQMAINRDNFDGRSVVTCNSCHRGSTAPVATPVMMEDPPAPAPDPASTAPAAGRLIDRYIEALGGAEAIEKISSRVEKATTTQVTEGRQASTDILFKAPGRRLEITHTPEGDALTAYDGRVAWAGSPGGPASAMSPAATQYLRFDADLHLPIHLKQIFVQFQLGPPETVNGHVADVVIGLRPGEPPVTFYFDRQSGLLVRLRRYSETPLGPNPWQADFSDYRAQDGVQIPFRRSYTQSGYLITVDVHQVQQNIPIDDARFAPPHPGAEKP